MKNLKRIMLVTLALMLCLSTVSFAAMDRTEGYYTLEGALSADSVKAGETITFKIYVYETAEKASFAYDADESNGSTITPCFYFPETLGTPTVELSNSLFEYPSRLGIVTKEGVSYINKSLTIYDDSTFGADAPIITYTFTATADVEGLAEKVYFNTTGTGIKEKVAIKPLTTVTVPTPAKKDPTGGEAVKVAVAEKVGLGKYAAKQFDITNTDEVTVYGFTSTFKPVYAGTADAADKPIIRDFYFAAAEGINAASFKFNSAIADIVTETEVVEVEISAAPILTAKQ